MSELREYLCIEAKTIERKDVHCYRFTSATKSAPEACMEPVYLKSEADKVIAEKDAEIARLKAIRKVHVEAIESMGAGLQQDEEEILHQKYKRCLAMAYAEWLKQMNLCNYPESILYRRAARRERKWKEIAEKFKEEEK